MALIRIDNLSYTYPTGNKPALHDISLDVRAGEYLAIVGANGSGKSTLARCLNGLLRPPRGSISFDGLDPADPSKLRDLRRRLSLVFQSPVDQLVASVVEEDVAFGLENLGMPRPEMRVRVEEALKAVSLLSERARPPRFLSAGQQQRLAVAGVLAMAPECVIFDEATAMIDPAGREAILGLMDTLVSRGVTVIHVTHDMAEAARAGRVLVLAEGRQVFTGSPAALFARSDLAELRLLPPPALELARTCGLEPVAGEDARALGRRLSEQNNPSWPSVLRNLVGDISRAPAPYDGSTPGSPPPAPPNQTSLAFETRQASLEYLSGTPNARLAVDRADIAIPRGALVALVGPTGSGKSSVLQLLDALALPTSGQVLAFGLQTNDPGVDPKAVRIRAPLVIQRPESAIFEQFCGDEVAFGPRNLGIRGTELVVRVAKAMSQVGLDYREFRDRHTRFLSGGEKRRLAIASVLAMESEALLFDEPGSALDPLSRLELMSRIQELAASGKTVVFATHSMEEAASADYMAVLGTGRVLAWGPPSLLFGEAWDAGWGLRKPFAQELAEVLAKGRTDAVAKHGGNGV